MYLNLKKGHKFNACTIMRKKGNVCNFEYINSRNMNLTVFDSS